jgi:hypothetical protein
MDPGMIDRGFTVIWNLITWGIQEQVKPNWYIKVQNKCKGCSESKSSLVRCYPYFPHIPLIRTNWERTLVQINEILQKCYRKYVEGSYKMDLVKFTHCTIPGVSARCGLCCTEPMERCPMDGGNDDN